MIKNKFNFRTDIIAFRKALWDKKKRILKDKHGIDWKTLAEMNPDMKLD